MEAKVFFLSLTDEQRKEVNGSGWACEIGKAYHAAKDGAIDDHIDLFEHAVTINDCSNAETIWCHLQQVHGPWTDMYEAITRFPRSMDVGDFIVWADGSRERCAACGFDTV